MSKTGREVSVAWINALGVGDVEALKAQMTEDIEAIATGTSVLSGTRNYRDLMEVAGVIPRITKSGLNPTILSVTAEDDRVAIEWEGHCELINGQRYDNQYHMLFFIREGKVCKLKEYFCTKLADEKLAPLFSK